MLFPPPGAPSIRIIRRLSGVMFGVVLVMEVVVVEVVVVVFVISEEEKYWTNQFFPFDS